jgi:hypothetical protein
MDKILEAFLRRQKIEGEELASASALLDLLPVASDPPHAYRATFQCKGLVRPAQSAVSVGDQFIVGINFPSDYLRRADTAQVLAWLKPVEVFHPNIRAPFICVGKLVPGTPLVDILYQVFEIITYNKVTMREDDALNHEACAWARNNQNRFPIDTRPLKRSVLESHSDPFAGVIVEEVNPS